MKDLIEKVKKPEYKLTPRDVIEQVSRLGFSVKPKTLQRRYQDELIPRPFIKGGGRGKGTIVPVSYTHLDVYKRQLPGV